MKPLIVELLSGLMKYRSQMSPVTVRYWVRICICCNIILYLSYCSEPGVPYNVTVRASTAVGKGEPVSIVVFAEQLGRRCTHYYLQMDCDV